MHNKTYDNIKLAHKKLKPGLLAFYDVRSGNGAGLFSKEKISKGGDISKEKVKK